jgi:hypothetical protein
MFSTEEQQDLRRLYGKHQTRIVHSLLSYIPRLATPHYVYLKSAIAYASGGTHLSSLSLFAMFSFQVILSSTLHLLSHVHCSSSKKYASLLVCSA